MSNDSKYVDNELFDLIKEGEGYALKILFRKYYDNLCRFAYTIIRDRNSAEEIVSDVFMKIWEKRNDIKIKTSFKSYLYRSVKNQSLNYLKRVSFKTTGLDTQEALKLKSNENPEDFLFYEELKDVMNLLVDKLPEKRRIIFEMSRFDGLSFDEIAEILSISVYTVRNQLVKAVKFLSEQYPRLQ
ncbi:MAG: RNA polymerase sigma-70 factor [Ignavibacteria bacterium]|jgi:RNA polymerase sigma-70 factor (ECF subfamily)